MRSARVLAVVCATVLLGAGCGGDGTEPAAAPGPSGSAASSAPSPTASGNGVADQSAEEILANTKAALRGAKSVRIKGAGGSGADQFAIDMRYAGTSSIGTVTNDGQPLELRRIGTIVYMKGSRAFWTANGGAPAAELLTGRWLKTPLTDKRFAQLAEITDLTSAAEGLLEPDGKVAKGPRKTIDGVEAIGLTTPEDDGVLYVATSGEPYPLRIEGSDGSADGQLLFTDYGKPVSVTAPPAELVIDVTRLGG